MRNLTEADIENLLAEGEWRRTNQLGEHLMRYEHEDPTSDRAWRLGNDHSQSPFSVDRPHRDKDWWLVAIGVIAVAVGMLYS